MQQYMGTYRLGWGSVLMVTRKAGRLYVAGKNLDAELEPLSAARFYLEDDDRELQFLKGKSGKKNAMMFGTCEAKRELGNN
jgi:hypothetical protein